MTSPGLVERPAISGIPAVGHELRCRRGTWSGTKPLTYAYRWRRNGRVVGGRIRASYRIGTADAGRHLSCTVTATNTVGSARARSAAVRIRARRKRSRESVLTLARPITVSVTFAPTDGGPRTKTTGASV